jgi:hypothetical protein
VTTAAAQPQAAAAVAAAAATATGAARLRWQEHLACLQQLPPLLSPSSSAAMLPQFYQQQQHSSSSSSSSSYKLSCRCLSLVCMALRRLMTACCVAQCATVLTVTHQQCLRTSRASFHHFGLANSNYELQGPWCCQTGKPYMTSISYTLLSHCLYEYSDLCGYH